MSKLEDIQPGMRLDGVIPGHVVLPFPSEAAAMLAMDLSLTEAGAQTGLGGASSSDHDTAAL